MGEVVTIVLITVVPLLLIGALAYLQYKKRQLKKEKPKKSEW